MDNKLTVEVVSMDGVELGPYIRKHKAELKNKRIFYVVRPNLEQGENIFKVGISERGDNSAIGRLLDYVYFYGVTDKKNKCLGCKLHVLLANTFNPDVEYSKSAVRKLETRVLREFEDKRERGRERLKVPLETLLEYLRVAKYNTKDTEPLIAADTEVEVRRTPRLAEKEQAASAAIKRIVREVKGRRGNVKFEVEFMDGFRYDVNQRQVPFKRTNEVLTYDQIVQLPRGKMLLDTFIAQRLPAPNNSVASRTRSRGPAT